MLWFLVLSVLVAGSFAAEDCCSIEDRKEIKTFWHEVWGAQYADRRVDIAQQVFIRLFEADPSAKELFKRVNVDDLDSPEFKAHCVRVINGLDVILNLLADPETLISQLAHLNQQHKDRPGVKAHHFEEMGRAFSEVLPAAGSCFNPGAWSRCYNRLTHAIAKDL